MIPIKNVYYMLCYAWESTLKQEGESLLDNEAFNNIYNLLTTILLQGVRTIIKSGFAKGYLEHKEQIPLLRGKVNLGETIKGQALTKRKLVCDYDEFTENIYMNRIINSTIKKLITCPELDKRYKYQCKVILRNFSTVDEIELRDISWNRIAYSRNNKSYRLVMNICQLIHTGLITTEEKGNYKFATFIKDRAMAKLYEKFVLNFYKKELKDHKVYAPIINWDLDEKPEDDLLPQMRTDIVIESQTHRMIIDTKYCPNALTKSNLGETKTLISNNLYQIYAYVKNTKFEGKVSGMLLYPTVDYDLEQNYMMGGNDIHVNTVNLGEEFEAIRQRLLGVVRKTA